MWARGENTMILLFNYEHFINMIFSLDIFALLLELVLCLSFVFLLFSWILHPNQVFYFHVILCQISNQYILYEAKGSLNCNISYSQHNVKLKWKIAVHVICHRSGSTISKSTTSGTYKTDHFVQSDISPSKVMALTLCTHFSTLEFKSPRNIHSKSQQSSWRGKFKSEHNVRVFSGVLLCQPQILPTIHWLSTSCSKRLCT